jgi:hypothetical protein
MQLEDEKVAEYRKLRRLENQKVGGYRTCQPSYLPTFLPAVFLAGSPSCSSPSYHLIFLNICVYWCSSVVSFILFPIFSFLFPISYL